MVAHNFFDFFSLPQRYQLDEQLLLTRYRAMQRVAHPDRHAGVAAQQKRLAIQRSGLINEGYETLRAPLARARHLMECAGIQVDDESTTDSKELLERQMSMHERLAELRTDGDPSGLDKMREEIETEWEALQGEFARCMEDARVESAVACYRHMQFVHRLRTQLHEILGGNQQALAG